MPTLGYKKLSPKAKPPVYATDGSACFDLVATSRKNTMTTAMYNTGLAFDIPDGYHLKVYSRSGHGFNDNIRLCNSTGIIDADYTGEVMVKLSFDGAGPPDWPFVGDRVAQAMLVKNVVTKLVEVDVIKETERGDGGFGSTGK